MLMEVIIVVHPDLMDDEDFCRHMSKRHVASLGGLHSIEPRLGNEETIAAWRAFHRRLHALYPSNLFPQVSHDHGEIEPND